MYSVQPILLLILIFIAVIPAIPLSSRTVVPRSSGEYLAEKGHTLSRREARSTGLLLVGCELPNITPPTIGEGKELSPPDPGLKLSRVVLGLGNQKYSCTNATTHQPLDVPVAIGAEAVLYDASCLVVNHPDLLHKLPSTLVQVPGSTILTFAAFAEELWQQPGLIVGEHYFTDSTTPTFTFFSAAVGMLTVEGSIFLGKVEERVPAPSNAAEGAVDWLRLGVKEGTVTYKAGYRVVTAGGKPPADCLAYPQGGGLKVPYAAEYWFYI